MDRLDRGTQEKRDAARDGARWRVALRLPPICGINCTSLHTASPLAHGPSHYAKVELRKDRRKKKKKERRRSNNTFLPHSLSSLSFPTSLTSFASLLSFLLLPLFPSSLLPFSHSLPPHRWAQFKNVHSPRHRHPRGSRPYRRLPSPR